ncbi:MAG: PmoA family protein [Chryseosolibacter sp.]
MKRNVFIVFLLFLSVIAVIMAFTSREYPQSKRFAIVENKGAKRLDVLVDGKPFTSYIYPDDIMKPVLYPLRTAEGSFITRGWPMDPRPGERVDHPHHVGMWFNYGDVNGLDFWNNSTDIAPEKKNHYGVIRHRKVNKIESGNDKAILDVTMDWQKPDGGNLLREDTRFIFSGSGNMRTIERITKLTALQEDVSFKDNKEGVIGIRLARALEHPSNKPEVFTDASGKATAVARLSNEGVSGKYRSSEGKEGDDVWGTRGQWVNLNGIVDAKPVSLVMLDHPENVGYPTYWHARGYGLFSANPLGQKEFSKGKEILDYKLPAGRSVTFRYKVLIHSGSHLTDEQVSAAFDQFSNTK